VQLGWHEHHEETMRRRRRLEELSQKAQDGTSSIDEDVERATIIEELDADDPLPVLLDVVARSPEHALARFDAGRLLLARGDESGIAHLEAAMTLDRDAVLPACELVARYLEEQGRSSHAATYRSRMDEHMTLLTEAHREREVIDGDEGLEPHGLAPELVERVVVELRRCEQVACAYLVRKRMRVLDDEHPVYLLVVVPRPGWRHAWRESEDDPPTLSDLITDGIDVPVDLRVVVPGLRSTLVVNAAAVTGALTYESP
jgi:hypothetical protein